MPIGLVSDDDLQAELERLSPRKKDRPVAEIVDKPSKGRSDGDVNVPDTLRQVIGEESVINGRQAALQLAKDFGISPSSVSAYANGATSTKTYDTPSKSILSHINKSRERTIKKASHVLRSAMTAITQEKLDYTDAKDLSVIAKNMSGIIKDLEPQQVNEAQPNAPQFVIYAPSFKKEENFEVINVNE